MNISSITVHSLEQEQYIDTRRYGFPSIRQQWLGKFRNEHRDEFPIVYIHFSIDWDLRVDLV